MKTNSATVEAIYAAFGRGDIPAILDQLADDVQWETWASNSAQTANVPYMKAGIGKQAALDYFGVVAQLNITKFQVLNILEGGHQVASEFIVEAGPSAFSTGYSDEEMHLWTFNDAGKVTRLRHYLDTFKHMEACKVSANQVA